MSKSSWVSKVVRIAAMAAGSAAFVGALIVAGGRVPVAAAQPTAPATSVVAPVGPLGDTCRHTDGRACPTEGIKIHCANDGGGISTCLCFEGFWSCP
jgi:hypothetical protein